MTEDERLVRLAQRGDQLAFIEVIQGHQRAVYSLCYRMTGNAADAEDLAQETFLRFYASIKRFRPASPLRPWLHRIAANVTLDALRKRRVPSIPIPEVVDGLEFQVPADVPTPEEACLAAERQAMVRQALLEIPADHRIALVLFYLEGLSYREVAETLGVSESAVETRLFRARKALAVLLRDRVEDKEGKNDAMHLV